MANHPTAPEPAVPSLSSTWSRADRLGMLKVRLGIGRGTYRTEPGLYRLGAPGPDSPVLVTCNYKLTVDVVRRDAGALDAWLLVVDTRGINVWCAAGKKTFSSAEVAKRAITSGLFDHVAHETLVVPQLAATGVAAHEVRKLCGYRVVFGPVRSTDIREYLDAGMKATPAMRQVTFTLKERMELAPVEFLGGLKFGWWVVPLLAALAGIASAIGDRSWDSLTWALPALFPSALVLLLGATAGGIVLPALLPWLPGRSFSLKAAIAGAALALLALTALPGMLGLMSPWAWGACVLSVTAIASYVGVNFTGSTPYTSPSGVERELRKALPLQAIAAAVGLVLWFVAWFVK